MANQTVNAPVASAKLTPAQRANLFAQATRQYKQELPSIAFVEGQTINVTLPKTRFLSKISLRVKGTYKLAHATDTAFTASVFDKYNLIKQLRLSINNGFNPYQLSGSELAIYNIVNNFVPLGDDNFYGDIMGKVVSSGGASNAICFTMEMPISLNDRDAVGLLMLQNEQTVVTLSIDCGSVVDMMTETDIVSSVVALTVTPIIETYSIPMIPDAIPDYSIIKLVNAQSESVTSPGDMIIKLPVGLTYRKIMIYIANDAIKTPVVNSTVGLFSLVFNQADTPYSISADEIAYENRKAYGGALPAGCYVLDFSTQGIANMGGGRDYIDTERLTEFWLKINFKSVSATNYVYVVAEKLARLV